MRSRDDLVAALRAAGLRATAPRVAVLGALHQLAPASPSHPELAAALASEGWDRATVYRNLIDLVEAGIATREDRGDHTWRFALKGAARATGTTVFVDDDGSMLPTPEGAVDVRPWRGCPAWVRDGEFVVTVRRR